MFERDDSHARHRAIAHRDCDHPEEISQAATLVAAAMMAGHPAEVALAPGNGTRYCFLFVPVSGSSRYVSPREGLESSGVSSETGVWIAYVNGPGLCYPLDLLGREEPPAPSYLAEKWFRGDVTDDVFVFETLLYEIGLMTRRPTLAEAS